ncbi:MAG: magnesium transporter [Actinobacteria bacterium]|nr:magnesium transporter [Actinomycetota bacterium]
MASARRVRIPRRAKRLFGYWRAERRTLRQGLVALALSTLAGFVAGLTLQGIGGTLVRLPGFLILIPAAVGMRGTIFGAIGARLGTENAAGTFEISFRRGGVLARNAEVAVLTTFSSALWLGLLAKLAAAASGQPSISLGDLITISVVGGVLGSAFILAITIALSVLSYRRGWDLDSVSTPMVTALGDMATLPTLYLATFLVRDHHVAVAASAACGAVALVATIRSFAARDRVVRRIVLEMTAVILLTPILDIVSGALQEGRLGELRGAPVLLALIPPFVSQAGALGGIFSSRISSKLQLGVVTPSGLPEVPALVDASIVLGLGVLVFALIGTVAVALSTLTGHMVAEPGLVILGTLVAGLIATPLTIVVSYELAVWSYRFGLDPDNQTVPIITSVMDLAGVACILFVMSVSGVLHG